MADESLCRFAGLCIYGMARISIKKAAELLLAQDDIIILCHRYPDGDTIGSAFALCMALRSQGKRANVICGDIIPAKYGYIYAEIPPMDVKERFVVSVDVADPALLGLLESEYAGRIDLCIDHHGSNRISAKYSVIDSNAAAAGEIIYRFLTPLGVPLTRCIAAALYTAIATDTGCFRYSNVTARTHRIAARLLETGFDSHNINQVMFETKSRSRFLAEQEMLGNLDFRYDGRMAIIVLTNELMERTGIGEGEIDGLSAIARSIEGVELGIMIREVKDGYKVSARTSQTVNACEFCKLLGGGGHPAAAGCTIAAESVTDAKNILVETAKSFL